MAVPPTPRSMGRLLGRSAGVAAVGIVRSIERQRSAPRVGSTTVMRLGSAAFEGSETETSLPFEPAVALPSTGTWMVAGSTSVKWPNNPAGGAFLVRAGLSFDAGSALIASVEFAGAWDEVTVPWSYVHVAGAPGDPPYAVVGSYYAIDAIGTPDEVTITARWFQIA